MATGARAGLEISVVARVFDWEFRRQPVMDGRSCFRGTATGKTGIPHDLGPSVSLGLRAVTRHHPALQGTKTEVALPAAADRVRHAYSVVVRSEVTHGPGPVYLGAVKFSSSGLVPNSP